MTFTLLGFVVSVLVDLALSMFPTSVTFGIPVSVALLFAISFLFGLWDHRFGVLSKVHAAAMSIAMPFIGTTALVFTLMLWAAKTT